MVLCSRKDDSRSFNTHDPHLSSRLPFFIVWWLRLVGFVCFCGAPAQHIGIPVGLRGRIVIATGLLWCNRHQQSPASIRVQPVTVFPSALK